MENNDYNVIIIGGGVSGMAAAITSARNKLSVAIIERNDRVGKKLLMTGNGRCNFGNLTTMPISYNNPKFVSDVVARSKDGANKLMEDIGIISYADSEGRIYPISESANSVLDCMRFACEKEGVTLITDRTIESVFRRDTGFLLTYNSGETTTADKVIIATGGKSQTSHYNLDKLVESRNYIPIHPALTPIKVASLPKTLAGLRVKCRVSLMKNQECVYTEFGEVQFKDGALSGIPILNISSLISRDYANMRDYSLNLDLLPNVANEELAPMLKQRLDKFGATRIMTGMFHSKLSDELKRRAISMDMNDINGLAYSIRHFDFGIVGLMGYDFAQVTTGGIDTHSLKATLEFKKTEGLYACGEAIDIDGLCGGYNLCWALTSGVVAGRLE